MNKVNNGDVEKIFSDIENVKGTLKEKFIELSKLRDEMYEESRRKKALTSGRNGTAVFEDKIRELEKRLYKGSPEEREEIQNQLDENWSKLGENMASIKTIQSNLTETSNKILELSKVIFGNSTEIIIKIIKAFENNTKLTSENIDPIEIRYFEKAFGRIKRISKILPEEEERIRSLDLKSLPREALDALKEILEIQRETLEIVCSPIIEVVPESERKYLWGN